MSDSGNQLTHSMYERKAAELLDMLCGTAPEDDPVYFNALVDALKEFTALGAKRLDKSVSA